MKKTTLILMALPLLLISCKAPMSVEEFKQYEEGYYRAYATNELPDAEKALKEGLLWLSQCERNRTIAQIDFDAQKASFHERLFLVYQALQQTNRMEEELRSSLVCVNKSRLSQGLPILEQNEVEFGNKLQNLDLGKAIHWRALKGLGPVTNVPTINE